VKRLHIDSDFLEEKYNHHPFSVVKTTLEHALDTYTHTLPGSVSDPVDCLPLPDQYIVGFTDGEGCFNVNFSPVKDHRQGIRVGVSFSISQHQRSQEILYLFQECFYHCGRIRRKAENSPSVREKTLFFEIRKVNDLCRYVLPFFDRYPLCTRKWIDYVLFREICQRLQRVSSRSRTLQDLFEIIDLGYWMNSQGDQRKLKYHQLLEVVSVSQKGKSI